MGEPNFKDCPWDIHHVARTQTDMKPTMGLLEIDRVYNEFRFRFHGRSGEGRVQSLLKLHYMLQIPKLNCFAW